MGTGELTVSLSSALETTVRCVARSEPFSGGETAHLKVNGLLLIKYVFSPIVLRQEGHTASRAQDIFVTTPINLSVCTMHALGAIDK